MLGNTSFHVRWSGFVFLRPLLCFYKLLEYRFQIKLFLIYRLFLPCLCWALIIYLLICFYALWCSILVTAFVGCAIAFGCFSAAAVFARRREFLYLGALLSSGVSILFWLQFASSIFGGSASLFKFEVCFTLDRSKNVIHSSKSQLLRHEFYGYET